MAYSENPQPSGVRLDLIADEKVFFDRRGEEVLAGQHAYDADGEYVFVIWQYLDNNAYRMDLDVFEQIEKEVTFIYVVDVDNKDLIKFDYSDYENAPKLTQNGDILLAPKRWEFVGFWERCADNCLRGIYD